MFCVLRDAVERGFIDDGHDDFLFFCKGDYVFYDARRFASLHVKFFNGCVGAQRLIHCVFSRN